MKIGFVLDDTLDTADGVQQYVLLLGSWLSAHGHDIHYLTARSDRKDVDNVHSLGRYLRLKFNRNIVPLVLPTSPRKIARLLTREKFDVLHVQMPYSPAFGARVVSLAPPETAVVGTFHIAPYAKSEYRLSTLLGYWLKPTRKRFDAVVSVSVAARDFARQSFGLDSTVVPNMIDIQKYKLNGSLKIHRPVRIIFVGRLVERKGCRHLIKSLALVNEPFRATIVGDGNQRPRLESLARSLKLNEKITFAGFVSESKKRQLLRQADIAVFPATGGESFGIVLLEAMAAGSCVVLGGNNPGYTSVLGSLPESLFSPTDHDEFAARLTACIQNKATAHALYSAQQTLVQQYDVNTVASHVYRIYQKAIANRQQKLHTLSNHATA